MGEMGSEGGKGEKGFDHVRDAHAQRRIFILLCSHSQHGVNVQVNGKYKSVQV